MDAAIEYGVENVVPRVVMHHLPEVRAQPISDGTCLIRTAQLIASF
jgi:hypothetical protein